MKKVLLGLFAFSSSIWANQTMNILIQTDNPNSVIKATLADNDTARDFYRTLPLEIRLENYASVEKIGYDLPKLSTQNSPKGYAGQAGDLTYYAPWGNLAIFTENSHVGYANGLIFFGKITQGLAELKALPDGVAVKIVAE